MGYETRLVIGNTHAYQEPGTPISVSTWATIDLAKPGYESATGLLLARCRKAAERFYCFYVDRADDAERFDPEGASCGTVSEDLYGERITAVPLRDLVAAMRQDNTTDGPYRRFEWAIALLTSMAESADPREHLVVLQYGH